MLRALAKEPEDRYQSCHEFLEDLRNYRSVAAEGNPRATVPSLANRNAQPNATVAMNPGLRGMAAENPQMTPSRRVAETFADPFAANASPMQTPLLRRTDHIPPYEPPEEKSIVWTVLAALVLVGVIGFGAYKLKPVLYDVRHPEAHNEAIANAAAQSPNCRDSPPHQALPTLRRSNPTQTRRLRRLRSRPTQLRTATRQHDRKIRFAKRAAERSAECE